MASIVSGIIENINVSGTSHAIASTAYGICDTAASTAIKNVEMTGFKLDTGVTIHVKFTNANSASNPKLKFNSEADSNAKPIVQYGTTAVGTTSQTNGWYAGAVVSLTYDGTSWVRDQGFNTNDNNFANQIGHYNNIKARAAITAESLIVGDATGYEKVASGVTFDISYAIVWCTAAVAKDSSNYANMFLQHYDRNIATGAKTGFTSAANKVIYLIVTINGNIATIDSNIITDTLPSNDDGKVYISLGKLGAQSTGANYFFFYPVHPMFWYKNGAIREYSGASQYALAAPLSGISGADDLKAIEALTGTSGLLKKTAANTWALDTSSYVTSSGITSVTIGATSPVQSSTSTAQTGSSASTTISLADAYGDTKNPYGSKTKNYVLAAPSNANGAPSFRALVAADIPALTYVPAVGGVNDVNTLVNTGIYNITSGSATNGPKGYGYGQLLVMSYRKHTGNTTTDWASQIYLHNGGGTASGNATAPGNVLYYRTSNNSSSNTWFDWQKAVHAAAAYSKVGDTNKPVYIAEDGTATAISYTIAKSVPSDAVFTDHYAWGDITGKPTKITLTGAVTGNVSLGEGELTLSTSVNHNHNSSYLTAVGYDTTNKKIYYTKNGSNTDVVTAATLRTDMGLSNALHFIGITSTSLSDGSTTSTLTAKSTNSLSKTTGFVDGDVVMDGDQLREYVWSGSAWRLLGITTSTAYSQTATGNSWIASITQGTDGKITATTGSLVTTGEWSGNAVTATSANSTKWLMNRGATTGTNAVTITDSLWNPNQVPSGHTAREVVWKQRWTEAGITYTPSGGSETTNSDTADLRLWLSSSNTGNVLQVNMDIDGQIYALGGFKGNLSGNASTATSAGKWTTARTLTIGNKGQSVDGSGNVSWSLSEIGAAAADHGTHVTTATVQSALGISSSGSGSKALTEKGTFVTFGTSNLTIGNTSSTAMAGNTTVTNVSYTSASDDAQYPILMKNSTGATSTAAGTKFNTGVTINPSASSITATEFIGNIKADKVIPIITKTYTNVIATVNSKGNVDQETGGFFYAKVRGLTYDSIWHTKFRITASVPGNNNFYATSIYDLWGFANTYSAYKCQNAIRNTGYRPLYYNTYFRINSTGYNNNMWGWIGFSLYNANSSTDTNLKRTVIVELLEYDNCTVEMQDNLVIPTNIPNRTTSGYYNSTSAGYDNFDFCNNGLRETGDDNTTSISNLYMQYGGDVAANLLCRYQLIFENADHKFVSIYGTDNKNDVTNKTLLTVDFDPNGRIFYHNTSGTTAANANIDPGRLYYAILADLRYSFNVTSTASATTFTGVRYTPLYLKTEMTAATGMVHVASDQPLVTTLPTQADNCYYIYLGQVHDWYRVMLDRDHPVYYHNGTEIVRYKGKTSVAWTSITGRPTNLNQFTNGPGYVTSSGVTSITLKAGAGITLDTDNTAITSTGTRTISISGIDASSGSETTCLTARGTWEAFNNYSLPTAKNDTLGGVKPWYSHTTASTGPTTGSDATAITVNTIQTTAGRYYAIESDSNGRLFVNVPWTNVNNSYLTSHNNLVKQTVKTSGTFKLLASAQASPSSGTAYEAVYDAKIYMNTAENYLVAGGLVVHDKGTTPIEKATLKWNSTDQALEFIFA